MDYSSALDQLTQLLNELKRVIENLDSYQKPYEIVNDVYNRTETLIHYIYKDERGSLDSILLEFRSIPNRGFYPNPQSLLEFIQLAIQDVALLQAGKVEQLKKLKIEKSVIDNKIKELKIQLNIEINNPDKEKDEETVRKINEIKDTCQKEIDSKQKEIDELNSQGHTGTVSKKVFNTILFFFLSQINFAIQLFFDTLNWTIFVLGQAIIISGFIQYLKISKKPFLTALLVFCSIAIGTVLLKQDDWKQQLNPTFWSLLASLIVAGILGLFNLGKAK